jgi:hypothetical protein
MEKYGKKLWMKICGKIETGYMDSFSSRVTYLNGHVLGGGRRRRNGTSFRNSHGSHVNIVDDTEELADIAMLSL